MLYVVTAGNCKYKLHCSNIYGECQGVSCSNAHRPELFEDNDKQSDWGECWLKQNEPDKCFGNQWINVCCK